MTIDRDINRNRKMWEILNIKPIHIRKLTPEERRKRREQLLDEVGAVIELSSKTIKEVFPSSE